MVDGNPQICKSCRLPKPFLITSSTNSCLIINFHVSLEIYGWLPCLLGYLTEQKKYQKFFLSYILQVIVWFCLLCFSAPILIRGSNLYLFAYDNKNASQVFFKNICIISRLDHHLCWKHFFIRHLHFLNMWNWLLITSHRLVTNHG